MNKISKIILSLSFVVGSLYAHGDTQNSNNHMGDHMHNGAMTNHANQNGMTDEQMTKMNGIEHENK